MTTETKTEWAVQWPEGQIEPRGSRAGAESIARLYAEAEVVHREVIVTHGPWVKA